MLESELEIIRTEFNQSDNYHILILKYLNHPHPDVIFWVAEARFKLINKEAAIQTRIGEYWSFAALYESTENLQIRILVAHAKFIILRHNEKDLSAFDFNEQCNQLIEYASDLSLQHPTIGEILTYLYWNKAEAIKHKDFFKAMYFYKKIKSFKAEHLSQNSYYYPIKADIAIHTLFLNKQYSQALDGKVLDLIKNYSTDTNISVQIDLKNLYAQFLQHKLDLSKKMHDMDAVNVLITPIYNNLNFQHILFDVDDGSPEQLILFQLSYIFWHLNDFEMSEISLKALFKFLGQDIKFIQYIKGLYFESIEIQEKFEIFVQDKYMKYINLNKYRELFKTKPLT